MSGAFEATRIIKICLKYNFSRYLIISILRILRKKEGFLSNVGLFLKPDKTRAASFLNSFKNIPQNAYPSGVRTQVQIVRGRYQHTRKTSGAYKKYGNFKSTFFSFSAYSLLPVVKGGWLNMLRKRKFGELKNQHYMLQNGLLIFLHSGKMQG